MSITKDNAPDHVFEPQEGSGRDFRHPDGVYVTVPSKPAKSPFSVGSGWYDLDQDTAITIYRSLGRTMAYWLVTQHYYERQKYGDNTARHAAGAFAGIKTFFRSSMLWLDPESRRLVGAAIREELAQLQKSPMFRS